MLDALGTDALVHDGADTVLRVSLPWIRSLPLAAVSGVEVRIDGALLPTPLVRLGGRLVSLDNLSLEAGWWFVQDRLALQLDRDLALDLGAGTHAVTLAFRLAVPYLQVSPDGPLTLPFLFERDLIAHAPDSTRSVARDVA